MPVARRKMTRTAPQLHTETVKPSLHVRIDPSLLIGLTLGAVAAGVLYACTPWGLGISHDSTVYFVAARRFVQGLGLSLPAPEGHSVPMTHFPPLYPLLVSLGSYLGNDNGFARIMAAMFLGINVLLITALVGRYTQSTLWAALAGLLMMTSPGVLTVHAYAWTEPPFLMFWLIGAALLARHLHQPRGWLLITSAIAVAVAFLSRYVGVTLVGTCCLALLLMHRVGWKRRIAEAGAFAVIAWIPVGLWLLRNHLVRGSATNRQMGYQPMNIDHWREFILTLGNWIWPFDLPTPAAVALALPLVSGVIVLQVAHRRWSHRTPDHATRPLHKLPALLWTFVGVYLGFLPISISYIDHATPLDMRILVPVFVCALPASIMQLHDLLPSRRIGLGHVAVATTGLIIAGLYIAWATIFLTDVRNDGIGYNHKRFVESTLWTQIAGISDRRLYTNDSSLVRYYTGRACYLIRRGEEVWEDPENNRELRLMRRHLATHGGYYVHFRHREHLRPHEAEIVEFLALQRIGRDKVGFLFERRPSERFQHPPSGE